MFDKLKNKMEAVDIPNINKFENKNIINYDFKNIIESSKIAVNEAYVDPFTVAANRRIRAEHPKWYDGDNYIGRSRNNNRGNSDFDIDIDDSDAEKKDELIRLFRDPKTITKILQNIGSFLSTYKEEQEDILNNISSESEIDSAAINYWNRLIDDEVNKYIENYQIQANYFDLDSNTSKQVDGLKSLLISRIQNLSSRSREFLTFRNNLHRTFNTDSKYRSKNIDAILNNLEEYLYRDYTIRKEISQIDLLNYKFITKNGDKDNYEKELDDFIKERINDILYNKIKAYTSRNNIDFDSIYNSDKCNNLINIFINNSLNSVIKKNIVYKTAIDNILNKNDDTNNSNKIDLAIKAFKNQSLQRNVKNIIEDDLLRKLKSLRIIIASNKTPIDRYTFDSDYEDFLDKTLEAEIDKLVDSFDIDETDLINKLENSGDYYNVRSKIDSDIKNSKVYKDIYSNLL